jgi:hypothetical protein
MLTVGPHSVLCWERATPVALMGCVIDEDAPLKRGVYSARSGALPATSGQMDQFYRAASSVAAAEQSLP